MRETAVKRDTTFFRRYFIAIRAERIKEETLGTDFDFLIGLRYPKLNVKCG